MARDEAAVIEAQAIRDEAPVHNIAGTSRHSEHLRSAWRSCRAATPSAGDPLQEYLQRAVRDALSGATDALRRDDPMNMFLHVQHFIEWQGYLDMLDRIAAEGAPSDLLV